MTNWLRSMRKLSWRKLGCWKNRGRKNSMGMNASIRNKDIFDHFIFINLYLYTLQQYIYDDEHAFMMNIHI